MHARILLAALIALLAGPAAAQTYIREHLRLPMAAAGGKGLETLFIRPAEPARYPLVIISHGAPRKPGRTPRAMTPGLLLRQRAGIRAPRLCGRHRHAPRLRRLGRRPRRALRPL